MSQEGTPRPKDAPSTPISPLQQSTKGPVRAIPVDHPPFRSLRTYAFDPSLSLDLKSAVVNQITMKIPWEFDHETRKDILQPGPMGEYVEIVDFDPASRCFYSPVDLDHPYLLAQDGLAPSEGNPQFHQQMVYAVTMTTIRHFEQALGRSVLWSPRYAKRKDEKGNEKLQEEYVQRLRIYPHALREANAYYSPQKKALLFGYFPATTSDVEDHLPGGTVFTCLSHDIIAHETTHALLDGMHRRFDEPTNPDMLAFHEAFADIVALFQHFTFPEVLAHQIEKTRGDLRSENLLGQLAQEFGQATGSHGALRDALGEMKDGKWTRRDPDPTKLQTETEPHARGSILVAAVFDAFVSIYESRIAKLVRVASNGTGILPAGQLQPGLVRLMADQAAKSANHILNMCIRALDYCPPVDPTFGDYLRALITADFDLVHDDDLGYRIAMVEAFRRQGIYPLDVRSLSIDSLRWQKPTGKDFRDILLPFVQQLQNMVRKWDISANRQNIFEELKSKRAALHEWLKVRDNWPGESGALLGLDFDKTDSRFEVHSLRPARRIGPDGQLLMDLIIEITQWRPGYFDERIQKEVDSGENKSPPPADFKFRGGCTLVVDLENSRVRYSIYKDIRSQSRLARQRAFLKGDGDSSLHAMYFEAMSQGRAGEPFAFLHRMGQKEEFI